MPNGTANPAPEASADADRPDWVGQRAVAWVLDEAPVPGELLGTLVVIARRCDKQGRGSRQTVKTIAEKAGKSAKQAQRDIVRLRELGLLLLGDSALVEHLPAGTRPAVYDLPLNLSGPKPIKESRNKSGLKAEGPPLQGTPPLQGGPPMDGYPPPPLEGSSRPPLEGVQKNPLKNPLNNPSLSSVAGASPDSTKAEDREKDEVASDSSKTQNQPASVAHRLLAEHDVTGDEADRLIPLVEGFSPGAKGPGWWRHIHNNGDLAELIVKARAQDADPSSGRPAWCGDCDEHTRQAYREDPHGRGMVLMRCPSCHPLTQPAQSTTDRKFAQAMDLAAKFDAYDNHPEPAHHARPRDRRRHSAVMAGGPGSRYDPPPGHRAVIQGVIASQVAAEDSSPDPYDAPL